MPPTSSAKTELGHTRKAGKKSQIWESCHKIELFNAQDIAYKYRGVKQRYDGTISCELPLNRCKARKAGATI
jgi:hypothetical protein